MSDINAYRELHAATKDLMDSFTAYGPKFSRVRKALEVVPELGGWVACDERLPTDNHCYYYCIIAKSNSVVMEATFNGKTRKFCTTMFKELRKQTVTHWMELPEPPNSAIGGKHETD